MSIFSRMFGSKTDRDAFRPVYDQVVGVARDPDWYRAGAVPDTVDGRFDMIAAVLALVLLRLEREGKETAEPSVRIAELFIEDMDGSVRQMGIGDLMVGKHVGKMMGALGGRITAFRQAVEAGAGFEPVVARNIFHDAPTAPDAMSFVARRLEAFHESLNRQDAQSLLDGEVPRP